MKQMNISNVLSEKYKYQRTTSNTILSYSSKLSKNKHHYVGMYI